MFAALKAAGRTRWIQVLDRGVLAAYCGAWAVYTAAMKDVARRGVLVRGRSSADKARGSAGMVRNPAVGIARDASTSLRQLAREMGFSPDSRGRINFRELEGPDHQDRHLEGLLT